MGEHIPQVVELDVRPQLREKQEPFQIILLKVFVKQD